ncbi:MAG: DNA translocase FtsK 4TM domain-containing protein, partial [Deltaproteobacteria bacterium]|nr:DNA translocase FtsK 4TM domain-containing protein [Deltaproteobacteria bacterium]
RRQDVLAILTLTATVLLTLALISYDARNGSANLVGPVGHRFARALMLAFGLVAWFLPLEGGLLTYRLFRRRSAMLGLATMGSTLVLVVMGAALGHLLVEPQAVWGASPGGAVGELLGEVLRSLLGFYGTLIIGFAILGMAVVLRTPWTLEESAQAVVRVGHAAWAKVLSVFVALREAWAEARELHEEEIRVSQPRIMGAHLDDDEEFDEEPAPPVVVTAPRATAPEPRAAKAQGPTIVAPKETQQKPLKISTRPKRSHRDFQLPPNTLLDEPDASVIHVDADALRENAELLTEKLAAYGVRGRVDEIHPGPVVTMYEFEPQSGTKVSKIASLADDLAMALAAQKVRIVAPIAGKARVGFELPNDVRQTVHLREILDDRRWEKHNGALPMALGKDIGGQPVYVDLARMPHLLVAGATGSGKSVALNVMLTSILAKKTPEEVRMLMIDPKVVELQVFDGIPHMLLPVVTDMKKASLALRWAVDEMERRYQMFADAGARNIDTYNRRVDRVLEGDLPVEKFMPKRKGKVSAQDANGQEILLDPADGEASDAENFEPEKLPSVVVVVDEFADLMMVAAKDVEACIARLAQKADVEACIARLAQKARAAGIHVILATQRPSVDVITGMIKANFPARIAFKVSQRQDSMTILGRSGAEHLLGMGDMLMIPPGASDLQRVHAAYVGEDEVKAVCDFLREQGDPEYQEEILKPRDDDGFGSESDDPLYDKAVAVVANAGYCSISHVQRQLSVGYNKAAKLVERMEQEGVVGPPSSKAGGRREVLVGPA